MHGEQSNCKRPSGQVLSSREPFQFLRVKSSGINHKKRIRFRFRVIINFNDIYVLITSSSNFVCQLASAYGTVQKTDGTKA